MKYLKLFFVGIGFITMIVSMLLMGGQTLNDSQSLSIISDNQVISIIDAENIEVAIFATQQFVTELTVPVVFSVEDVDAQGVSVISVGEVIAFVSPAATVAVAATLLLVLLMVAVTAFSRNSNAHVQTILASGFWTVFDLDVHRVFHATSVDMARPPTSIR